MCWFFHMQPSEYDALTVDEWERFAKWMDEYRKANTPKPGKKGR